MPRVAERDRTRVVFDRPELAAAWGFATDRELSESPPTVVTTLESPPAAPPVVEPEVDDGPAPPAEALGARVSQVADLPLLGYHQPASRRNGRATVSVVLAGLAVLTGFLVFGVLRGGPATEPSAPAGPTDTAAADSSVNQTRCSGIDGVGYFIGSFTNRTTETVSFRVDIAFLGNNGSVVGQKSERVGFIGPRATSPLDIRTGVSGDVTVCRATVARLPRGG